MATMLPAPKLKAAVREAAHRGRGDDTLIAHINPREAALLKRLGGAGTRNPETGALEFFDPRGAGGVGRNSDAQRAADARTAAGWGGSGGDAPSFGRTLPGAAPAAPAPGTKVLPGFTHTKQSPNGGQIVGFSGGHAVVGPTDAEAKQQRDIIGAWQDWNGRSFGRKVLDFAAGPFLNDNMPNLDDPNTYHGGVYHTSTNPLGVAASLVGGALMPGAGIPLGAIGSAIGPEVYHNPASPTQAAEYGMPGASKPGSVTASAAAPNGGGFSNTGGGAGGVAMLPPVAGSGSAAATPPGQLPGPTTSPTGVQLPPIMVPGGYQSVPGPTPYGWQMPAWQYPGRA
jgi:hypothetical protein